MFDCEYMCIIIAITLTVLFYLLALHSGSEQEITCYDYASALAIASVFIVYGFGCSTGTTVALDFLIA